MWYNSWKTWDPFWKTWVPLWGQILGFVMLCSPAWFSLPYLFIFCQERSGRPSPLLKKGLWKGFWLVFCPAWVLLFPSEIFSPAGPLAERLRGADKGCWCLLWGWWSHLHPWPEHSLLEQAPLLIAGLFRLSSILVPLPAALLEYCALLSTLLCWHSTTAIL